MKKFFAAVIFFSSLFLTNAFAQIKVLSPAEGVWANKQMLCIDNSDGAEYYYSLNGEDPVSSGFAYDNPVLIDLTGPVQIRIKKSGKKNQEIKINYTVEPDNAYDADYSQFIDSFYDTGIINYTAGSEIYIPYNLYYTMGLPPDSFIEGQPVSIAENTVISMNIPCVVMDKNNGKKWRFIIRTFPQNQGVFTQNDVPFEITDWSTISFLDDNYIYRIDDEYWELPKESKTLDRSVPHRIQWQSIAYEQGNPIETFELPAKPKIRKDVLENGSITYTIDGDQSYQMSILSPDGEYQEFFTEIGADTFYGNSIKGKFTIGIFSNSVYQGDMSVDYEINKKPPRVPEIAVKNPEVFYSRQSIAGLIVGQDDAELYVSVSEPFVIEQTDETYSPHSEVLLSIPQKDFVLVNGSNYRFNLEPMTQGACYYKVMAYSKKDSVTSAVTEYSVIIDKYNYYYDESYTGEDSDGTRDRPYNNFTQCLSSINNGRFALLMINGEMHIPSGKNDLLSNCTFVNVNGAEIIFEENASIVVKGSTLTIQDFTLLYEHGRSSSSTKMANLIKLENAVLDMDNCQIGAVFGKNAYLFDLSNSTLNVTNSIISVSAEEYVSFTNGLKSRITIGKSIVNASGKTCVGISLYEGDVKITESSFKVTGSIGRIAELFGVKGTVTQNTFKAELPVVKNAEPIYQDKKTKIFQSNNESYGF